MKYFSLMCLVSTMAIAATTPEMVGPPLASAQTSAPIVVNLSNRANVYGIVTDGKAVQSTGLDGYASAYLLSNVKSLGLGAPDVLDAVTSETIPLPGVMAASLQVTAIGVDGNQVAQVFMVNYADGTNQFFTQSLSNWWEPQKYPGETIVATYPTFERKAAPYAQPVSIYTYTFKLLTPAKQLASLVLPQNKNVVVLGVTVMPVAPTAPTYDTVVLNWTAPTLNTNGTKASIASYNIYKGTTAQVYYYANVKAPITTFSDPLVCGAMVNYSVTAVSTQGTEGALSPQVGKSCQYFAPTSGPSIK